jgi:hypothetical protein
MVPKFNVEMKYKLCLKWFKYIDIKNLNNNKVGKNLSSFT